MFKTPSQPGLIELVEKRSRFITYCESVQTEQEFKSFLNRLKKQYPDARHHCYGFRLGPLNSAHRGFSDDGEPNGTEGMPILNVIDHSEFSNIAIIVVRYFGGTKLGTGGLARAYSQAAKMVLDEIEWKVFEQQMIIELQCEFHQEHQLRYLVSQINGEILNVDYQERVKVTAQLKLGSDLSSLNLYQINSNDTTA